jgi:type VI secretion system secreted protein Hcp
MAVDYFLKIDGIEGENADSKHAKEIDVDAWSWGESQTRSAASGGGAAPPARSRSMTSRS